MKVNMETVLTVVAAVFVLFTAMVDVKASFSVALVAIVCVLGYMIMTPKKSVSVTKAVSKSKVATKKATSKKSKKSKGK